ncbi:hypothetical protein EUGRSUZ_K00989 [Eucalyptus grandis]|uniref:Uncharacterized protein n=2 Tax=Eucalyptus grandis TaxID=71139 RepID=A0ACC3IU17_EUCGR|nr:hypothetical protein EUGRSUZ_K00989 [Eucalyptus grandis]
MEDAISIARSPIWVMRNGRLETLKARNVPTPENQQLFGDGDLNKIMDLDLYKATENGDADKFIDALEAVSESRRLALSLTFDQVTPSGDSLLHVAARSGKEDVMELILIHFPYLVAWKNSLDDTPLHVTVQDGSLEKTRKLIPRRTDSEIIYWKNKDGKSPLYLAAETGDMEILRLLLEASARDEAYAVKIQGRSPVLAALEEKKSGVLEKILDRLPKLLHVKGEDGRTPLHSAASVGNVEAVQLLLRKCRYLALQTDKNGYYPIHIACEGDKVKIIPELLKIWPNLAEMKNKKGQNILHVAAKVGKNNTVQCILKECSDPVIKNLVNSKDDDGNTPLHLASMYNHCHVMLSLVRDKRSNVKLLNNDQKTALDVAKNPETWSSPLLAGAILIVAGVPQSEGGNVLLPRKSSGSGKSLRAEWIKDQVNTLLLVAILVATVTFTAGFTLPGGYNAFSDRQPGMATMLHNRWFQVFIISDTLAMHSSILAAVGLLWGHSVDPTASEEAYTLAGISLLLALAFMTVAFCAAVTVAVSKLIWLTSLVVYLTCAFLTMCLMFLATFLFPESPAAKLLYFLYFETIIKPGRTSGD